MKTILLTGVTGYLGSVLSHALVLNGFEVIVLKRSSSEMDCLNDIVYKIKIYDVAQGAIESVFINHNVDVVVHCATNYGRANELLEKMLESNVLFPLKVLEQASLHGVDSFVNTDTSLNEGTNAYSMTKSQFKQWGKYFADEKKISFINLRLEHFYGPDDGANKFTTFLIRSCLDNKDKIPLTLGEQVRDFIYIDDVVSAYLAVLSKVETKSPRYIDIDVGSGKSFTIKEVSKLIHKLTDSKSILEYGVIPYRENEPMFLQANTSFLEGIGWKCGYTLKDGLTRTIKEERNK